VKSALLVLAVLALSGCANNGMKAEVMGANIEIAKQKAQAAAKPVMDARIPTPNGEMHIVVHAPQGNSSGQVTMPEDPMWRVLDRGMGVLGTAAGIYLGGEAAVGLVQAAGSGIVNALKVQPAPTVIQAADPVIVPPADPVIVTQPSPVIIQQPEPIIIQPAP
jgi:hypothetical protein